MFQLDLLGSVALGSAEGPLSGAGVQRRRLALLALIAGAPPGGLSRDKAIAVLWPDSPNEQARRLLADSIYVLRRALTPDALVTSGDNIQLDGSVVRCDVTDFRAACARGEHAEAVRLYSGPFLDGFSLPDAPEFEQWADAQRADLARRYAEALEQLARAAESQGNHAAAAAWWSQLQTADMLNSRVALALMHALADSGDVAAALRHAAVHTSLLRAELDIAPPSELTALAERLRHVQPARVTPDAPARDHGSAARDTETSADVAAGSTAEVTAAPPSSAASRRRWIVPVAVTLVLVVTVALGAFLAARARTGARTIHVAVFENQTGDSTLDPLGTMAADWIARGLVAAGDVQVSSPGWIGAEAGTSERAAARAAARRARARTFVAGAYYRDGDRLRFDAQVVDTRSGRLLQALAPITVPADSVSVGVELLRQRITGALAARLAPRELLEITARAQPPLFDAYENYVEGVQLFSRYQGEEAARRFAAAWSLDTTFHLAALYEVLVSYNRGDTRRGDSIVGYLTPRRERMAAFDRALLTVFENERAADVEGVLRAMRRVATMAPGSQFSVGHAVAAIAANEPREALAVLLQLDPTTGLLRDNARYWDWRTTARHLLTDHRRELQDAGTARARHSDRRAHIAHEIRARAALGQVAEVEDLIQRGLALPGGGASAAPDLLRTAAAELRAHGHPDAAAEISRRVVEWYRTRPIDEQQGQRRAHAQALYDTGHYEEARALLATLPDDEAGVTVLGLRGVIAARMGDATEARRIADELATPAQARRRGANLIWSARIAAVLGEDDLAVQLLSDALAAGATYGLWLHTDVDLASLRRHQVFRRLVR